MLEVQCKECGTPRPIGEFFRTKRLDKYQNGHLDICRHCVLGMTQGKPDKFQWVLEEVDVPWIEDVWEKYEYYYPNRINLGRYINIMMLASYRGFSYKDSDELNKKEEF